MTIQEELVSIFASMRAVRSNEYMTLGELISALQAIDKDTQVANLHHPHSYRGYYEDLAFELGDGTRSAEYLLADCKGVIGRRLEGYKGGSYLMQKDKTMGLDCSHDAWHGMTPVQKIKWAIVKKAFEFEDKQPPEYPCKNVDELYDALDEEDNFIHDATEEVREGGYETGLDCNPSRHYESNAVAMKFPDGSWVGWTFWYGGGKYGEPESIDWINDAYDVECSAEKKLVTVLTFKRK